MRRDALDLERFYRSRQGENARRMILRRLTALWPEARGLDMLGIGFASPYLPVWDGEARRCIDFMPAGQGAISQAQGASRTAMGDEMRLPFPDALFDRVLMVHALEEADALQPLLREIWRVTAPQGRLALVAANRAGAWARADGTPFGHGRPFSKGQLSQMLDDALFLPTAWSRALYAPPAKWCCGPRGGKVWEQVGEHVWPGFGGVILAEAVKRVGSVTPSAQRARRRALAPAGAPALSPGPKPGSARPVRDNPARSHRLREEES